MSALEKAARALSEATGADYDTMSATHQGIARSGARAVLMAVRAESQSVAVEVHGDQDVEKEVDDFRAMIDAILNEEPK